MGEFSEMTPEQGFYYWVAVYGNSPDIVDRYATIFDADNYKRAMADEFVRARYRAAVQDRISSHVSGLKFSDKYIYISPLDENSARFAEYSFGTHAFPIRVPPKFYPFAYRTAAYFFDVYPFTVDMAPDVSDFTWSVPLSEDAAHALLEAHPDRKVTLRIVYSVMKTKRDVSNSVYYLTPFIHAVDVYADRSMTKLLGTLARAVTPCAWQDPSRLVAGQKTLYYKGRYRAYWGADGATPSKFGELPSKDAAEYYSILDCHTDGVAVKDYYSSGEIEMEGHFLPFCQTAANVCPDGLFTWYYKNGYKRQEETYSAGKETPYCTRAYVALYAVMWDEHGKCKRESTKECPCTDQSGHSRSASALAAASDERQANSSPIGMYVRDGAEEDYIKLNSDGTFSNQYRGGHQQGRYRIIGDQLVLIPQLGDAMKAQFGGSRITFVSNGESYHKHIDP